MSSDDCPEWKLSRFAGLNGGISRVVTFFKRIMSENSASPAISYLDDLLQFCMRRAVVTDSTEDLVSEMSNALIHYQTRCMILRVRTEQLHEIQVVWFQNETELVAQDRRLLRRIVQLVNEVEEQFKNLP
jgi:hypothetical protein